MLFAIQTRLTALDLIGFAAGDERPQLFVHMSEAELEQELAAIQVCVQHVCSRSCRGDCVTLTGYTCQWAVTLGAGPLA